MTPATQAQLLMWRCLLDADAVDYRAAAHGLLELAERLAAEGEAELVGGVESCVTHHGIVDEIGRSKYDEDGGRQCDMADVDDVCDIVPLYTVAVAGLRAATVPGTEAT